MRHRSVYLLQRQHRMQEYPVTECYWDGKVAKRNLDELIASSAQWRWVRLIENPPDAPARLLVDWTPPREPKP
jgi:hypothetical protein